MADRHYHGEVKTTQLYDSDARAEEIARQVGVEVEKHGGRLDVGRAFGETYAILILTLPGDATVTPEEVVGNGVEFKEVHAVTVQAVEDQGIRE